MMVLSATGLIAKDWGVEIGVNYAPPSFLGDDLEQATRVHTDTPPPRAEGVRCAHAASTSRIRWPMRSPKFARQSGKGRSGRQDRTARCRRSARRRHGGDSRQGCARRPRSRCARATLPFGGDKWGRDVLKKTIKGSETSIFVGLAAAVVATLLGTMFGAIAGYYGKWVDDFFNWFYSVFTAMPSLLLILAVAAVLQQKGMLTIVLILGLTGWTGIFRLIRGEYLKHKGREYVQAADAIGASNARRMFVHIFPNVSHVVLVQLSILTVGIHQDRGDPVVSRPRRPGRRRCRGDRCSTRRRTS